MRLFGMCERVASPTPLGPDVLIPDSVPLTVNFYLGCWLGKVTLCPDEDGNIWAEAYCRDDDERMVAFARTYPYFAIAVRDAVVTTEDGLPMGRVTAGEVAEVAIVERNNDPDLPPYKVLP